MEKKESVQQALFCKCGLTKDEFELEKLVDAVRSEPSTLICIKILERGFKKLNTPPKKQDSGKEGEGAMGVYQRRCRCTASQQAHHGNEHRPQDDTKV